MSKQNYFHNKLISIYEDSENLKEIYKDQEPFDCLCFNDHCCARNGVRYKALAWRNNSGGYSIYCDRCGTEEALTRENFKEKKFNIEKENEHKK